MNVFPEAEWIPNFVITFFKVFLFFERWISHVLIHPFFNIYGSLSIFSLKSNGHIYYLSDGKAGILGLIDASECVPTYGCRKILYNYIHPLIVFAYY